MAKSRSVPTELLSDPDYMELDSDTQVILLLLVLTADDEGRGRAHTGMLTRHFNKPAERIEHALATLATLDLVACYVVGRHRYYHLVRWWEWQTLSKPTPSRFPSPQGEQHEVICPRETQEIPGQFLPEEEGEKEGKRKGRETNSEKTKAEEEDHFPPGIMRFPHLSISSDDTHLSPPASGVTHTVPPASPRGSLAPVDHVAEILQLPVTEALARLVTEYTTLGELSLLGEADAAREWIDDPMRNHSQKSMTVAFFRRWLKREHDMMIHRQTINESQAVSMLATGTLGVSGHRRGRWENHQPPPGPRLPSLMHLADEDHQARGVCR